MRYYILLNMFLMILGCFLPWLIPGLFVVGLRGVEMIDGKVVLVLALIGFFAGAYHLISKRGRDWLYGAIGLAGTVISAMDFYQFYQNGYIIGPGVYLVALGGLQLMGSYVVILFKGGEERLPP